MKKLYVSQTTSQSGYSLVELMIVLVIIAILSAAAITRIYSGTSSNAGGGEGLLENVAERIIERRADAVRLNGEDRRSNLQNFTSTPLPIDFTNLLSTASLKTDGTDDNNDCVDDITQKALTCLSINNQNQGDWVMSYNDDPIKLPAGWYIVSLRRDLTDTVPLIADGSNGRGVIATSIGFDATGKAFAKETVGGQWLSYPTGSVKSDLPSAATTPFWAIYFFCAEKRRVGKSDVVNVTGAVAVAVHPSGLIEKFRYTGKEWVGFKNRTVD